MIMGGGPHIRTAVPGPEGWLYSITIFGHRQSPNTSLYWERGGSGGGGSKGRRI